MPVKVTTESFIERSIKKHGNKYDYSLVNYIRNKLPIKIICNKCYNIFKQTPNKHLFGHGCQNAGEVIY